MIFNPLLALVYVSPWLLEEIDIRSPVEMLFNLTFALI
jgi:hypothetical protein